jgi:hypothetical protein
MESYMTTLCQCPAVPAVLSTFQTVTSTDIPFSLGFLASEDDMGNRKIVGVFHSHSSPFGEQKMEICGKFHAVGQHSVNEVIPLSEDQYLAMGIVADGFAHIQKILIGGNVARNMETEETGSSKGIACLFPILGRIGLEDFQITIVGFLYILIDSAQLCSIALFGTGAVICTGDDGRQGNGFDFTHFPIALADGNFNSSHNVSPICCCCVGVSYLQ